MKSKPQSRSVFHYWACLLLGLMMCSCSLVQAGLDHTITQSYEVDPGGLLTVDTEIGSIHVDSWDKNEVNIEVFQEVKWGRDDDDPYLVVEFSQDGENVTITGTLHESMTSLWSWLRGWPRVKYRITVPETYDLDLMTFGGSVRVGDLTGTVRSQTSGGSLSFGEINGPVWGRTSGGSITLTSAQGDANVQTSGGSIKIGDVEGEVLAQTSGGSIFIERANGDVRAETSAGSIRVEEVFGTIEAHTSAGSVSANISGQPQEECHLSTSAGRITVGLAEGVAVSVDARTDIGSIHAQFPLTIVGGMLRHSLQGDIGGGGPKLVLRTSAGSIRLRRL